MLQSTVSGQQVPVTSNEKILPMFVDTKRFAELSGLSVDTICKMCKKGEVPFRKVGRRYLVNCNRALQMLDEDSKKTIKETQQKNVVANEVNKLRNCGDDSKKEKTVVDTGFADDEIARLNKLVFSK